MQVQVEWTSPRRFEGVSRATRARLTMETRSEASGAVAGPSPMETVLMALAGCTGIDVVSTLGKMREGLEGLSIGVTAERATEHPRVFTRIHLRYVAWGRGLRREQVERAVTLSKEKYCSVTAMLRKTAEITHDVVVADARPAAV